LILGVLSSPLINPTIVFKPFTEDTVNTHALSLGLYATCPNSIRLSSFLAKGAFFNPKVRQNLGLCFFVVFSFEIQI